MSFGYRLVATYESGFVLAEDDADHSPYRPGRNVWNAIIEGDPTTHGHGRLTAIALVPEQVDGRERYDVDVGAVEAEVGAEVRPIYYRSMHRTVQIDGGGDTGPVCDAHHFGYQYTDPHTGRNVQHVIEITS